FVWHEVDLHRQLQVIECGHHRFVKIGDSPWLECDRFLRAIAFQDAQSVIDKIKTYLERVRAMRNWRSRQTARGQIKGDVPGMVRPWCKLEPDFPYDLRPHVKRGAGVFPIQVIKLRPMHQSSSTSSA